MIQALLARLDAAELAAPYGSVESATSGRIEASGPICAVGDICRVGESDLLAQVAATSKRGPVLVPLQDAVGLRLGARVTRVPAGDRVPVGQAFAGRAVNALGEPIDDGRPVSASAAMPLAGKPPAALERQSPETVVETGIRAIDGLLTLGRGQRIGIFAASGVGKTSLIEQLIANAKVDRCVLCLVGERGREVEGLWRMLSAREDRDRFTLVAATSDESAGLRARSVDVALSLAEHWRHQGEHVLLVIDSVTRLAMALREIGLAAGEPPTMRAYTPNVFAALPRVVERCGGLKEGGAITAVMTVLSETDDVDDPIVETMKSLLDGHIVLSRSLAERGHFPAIDVPRSVSRQATRLMSARHAAAARDAAAQLGVYEEARVMIQSGIYQAGTTPEIDAAIAGRDTLLRFLRQGSDERARFATTVTALETLGDHRG